MSKPRGIADEIKRMHLEGANYTEIIAALGCSKSTVSYHVGRGNENARVKESEARSTIKHFLRHYKSIHPCVDCERLWPYYTMQFDHLPQFKKRFSISKFYDHTNDMTVVIAEMQKCDLVCGNCHSIRSHTRRLKKVKIDSIKRDLERNDNVSEEEG